MISKIILSLLLITPTILHANQNLHPLTQKYGILYFYSNNCPASLYQHKTNAIFEKYYRWPIYAINVDQQPQIAQRYNVNAWPTLQLIQREDYQPIIITYGVATNLSALVYALNDAISYQQNNL